MSNSTQETKREFFAFGSPEWIICTVIVAVGLALAVFVAFTLPDRDTQPTVPPQVAEAQGRDNCGLPVSDDTGLEGVPEATWRSLEGVFVPTSPDHGPARTENGIPTCFAESPEGAVFAASHMIALGVTGNMSEVLTHMATDTDATARMLAETPAEESTQSADYEIVGFQLIDYDKQDGTATVQIAMGENAAPPYGAMTLDLVRDGDWKFDPNSNLDIPFTLVSDDLSGFYAFSNGGR